MSKKLIAGLGVVAGLAVAMAPVATFADTVNPSDQHTDELVVTVLPSCTFGSAKKSGTPYPSGITHNAPTDTGYAADGSASAAQTRGATAWNTTQTTEASGSVTDTDEGGHNADDADSTGYGILVGEGGLTNDNSSTLSNSSEHTVHRSMYAGVSTTTFAKTTMYIVCNNGTGYSVTATAEDLSNGTTAEDIPVTDATISETTAATTSGYNGVVTTADSSDAPTNLTNITSTGETIIAKKTGVTKEDGDSITVTYGMSIKTSQKADTYDGKVVYKLYKGVNGAGNA
ncbi:hypothetical protein IJH46_01225 [Candidatus Saccharibacteria bacterium]|nr:hypothetical protein [Candidatus Saccharibacteria bacterium]